MSTATRGAVEFQGVRKAFGSFVAIALIGGLIIYTLARSERLARDQRARAEPVMSQ